MNSKNLRYKFACNECDTEWMSNKDVDYCPRCHKPKNHFFDFRPEIKTPEIVAARRESYYQALDDLLLAITGNPAICLWITGKVNVLKENYTKSVDTRA